MQPEEEWAIAAATTQGGVGLAFAEAMAAGEYDRAHDMLTPAMRAELSPAALQHEFTSMWSYTDGDTAPDSIQVISALDDWPGKQPTGVGWCYVSFSGPDPGGGVWNEAVAVVVVNEVGKLLIREVQWGRP